MQLRQIDAHLVSNMVVIWMIMERAFLGLLVAAARGSRMNPECIDTFYVLFKAARVALQGAGEEHTEHTHELKGV